VLIVLLRIKKKISVNMLTALSLTQAYGRSIRSEVDFCFTFVLDKCFLTFVNKNGDILQPCNFSTFVSEA